MHQMRKFLAKLYRGVGTPLALELMKLAADGQWLSIQSTPVGCPSDYPDADSYLRAAACVDIIRKCSIPNVTSPEQLRQKAVETFFACEAENYRTNARLARYIDNQGPFEPSDIPVIEFITRWRKEIRRVLGRCPHLLEPAFSGGSTLSDAGKLTTIPDKMSSVPTWYAKGDKYVFTDNFSRTPFLGRNEWVRVSGNRFFTVRKDNTKDRGCCTEASLNVMLQLAVGKILKKRYSRAYGVDLKQAQSLHRELARRASCGELALATIDLSNASDTVSRGLVRLLLPPEWYALLDSLRATSTIIDGKTVRLEKFSSMGNGFTFELETIIFKSLVTVIAGRETYCYGDDMIVPSQSARDVIAALRFFGFRENAKKTFIEGPFRESCGGDFWGGVPVRAHFLKEFPDEPSAWMALANGLRRMDPNLKFAHAAWRYCVDQIPKQIRVFGPAELGDIVIHDPDARPGSHRFTVRVAGRTHKCSPSPAWRVYRPVSRSFDLGSYWSYEVAVAAASLGVDSQVTPRDSVTGYTLDWVCAWGRNDLWGWCGS